MHTKSSRFVAFWSGSSLCLTYWVAVLVDIGVIRWGEDSATTIAYLCMMPIFCD